MNIDEIIDSLKKLNLDLDPIDQAIELFNQVGKIGYIAVSFHKGKSFIRARANEENQRFSHKNELSFKPQQFNTTYQRASTPNQTMFYASLIPQYPQQGELNNARLVCLLESMPWLRDKTISGHKKVTFGKWEVKEDINLIAVLHKDDYYNASSYTRELVDAYEYFMKYQDKKMIEKSFKYQKFLADEFSKPVSKHTDYLISAIFTEIITRKLDIDGVLYPSVRALGTGFNIAIKPTSCSKLQLKAVGESSVYKLKDKIVVGDDCTISLDGVTDTFNFTDNEGDKTMYLKELGVNSIDELF